jgi:L-ascorbate metabolism protein UlaG (beta-lactamase superfamily)
MKITRLGWAGIELEADSGETAVIDLLTNADPFRDRMGAPHTALPEPARPGAARLALVTHLHQDHTDADAIAAALSPKGRLLRPVADTGAFLEVAGELEAERRLVELGVRQQAVREWETVRAGAFTATAIPAADGFGDVQVSWIVEADGVRVFHGGDTLFHGWWWRAKMRAGGPIDYAFLPANDGRAAPPRPGVAAQRLPLPRRGGRRGLRPRGAPGGPDPLRRAQPPAELRAGRGPRGAVPGRVRGARRRGAGSGAGPGRR